MAYHCKVCMEKYTSEEYESNKVNTLKRSIVFQCTRCFSVDQIIRDIGSLCPICQENDSNTYFNVCGHSICNVCTQSYENDICCICKQINTHLIKMTKKDHDYFFDNIDSMIKELFRKLYRQVVDAIDSYNKEINSDKKLYELCVEYYQFLCLLHLNNNNNAEIKLSPPNMIDIIWHEHLLDNQSYNTVCMNMCGYVLFHYPENSFKSNKVDYQLRLDKSIELYKRTYGEEIPEWIWSSTEVKDYKIVVSNPKLNTKLIHLFVRMLSGRTVEFDVPSGSTIEDLKKIIYDREGISTCQQRLIFAGKQLQDEYTLEDYNIRDSCTLHMVLKLSGC